MGECLDLEATHRMDLFDAEAARKHEAELHAQLVSGSIPETPLTLAELDSLACAEEVFFFFPVEDSLELSQIS